VATLVQEAGEGDSREPPSEYECTHKRVLCNRCRYMVDRAETCPDTSGVNSPNSHSKQRRAIYNNFSHHIAVLLNIVTGGPIICFPLK